MRTILFPALAASAALLTLAGCGNSDEKLPPVASVPTGIKAPPAPEVPEAFLKWSMDRYGEAPSFHTKSQVTMMFDGKPRGEPKTREIYYEKPNRFKVVSSTPVPGAGAASGAQNLPKEMIVTAVSDGKKLVEYPNVGGQAMSYDAPTSLSAAKTVGTSHPMYGGSVLNQFFGGSANYASLVDASKGPVTFGPEEKTSTGELAKVVKFYGQEQYGHVEALISKSTGRVYRIKYDSEPMVKAATTGEYGQRMKAALRDQIAKMKPGPERDLMSKQLKEADKPHTLVTEETFTTVESETKFATNTFDTKLPEGVSVPPPTSSGENPPVPLGKPAPDFEVATMDGKPVKLSSMKGHVVLIDFWATWCGPCRKGLPETDRLAKVGGPQGLQVMGISNEEPGTISAFLKENKFTFPSYVDNGSKAQTLYGVSGIPTTVIVDAQGNLSAYLVGLRAPEEIQAALEKAGMKISG